MDLSRKPRQSLDEWLGYIEALHPAEIELGLERIAIVAERLQCRKFDIPVVTVTGTNGKGSFVKALAAIGHLHGLQVATYTSPHLFDFRERMQVNQQQVSADVLIELFERVDQACQGIPLTYFEFTTLAALLWFKQQQDALDLVVLEVGLGGRLDATNLVDADLAVITTVSLDHVEWLGPDLESIAREKAGVFRAKQQKIIGLRVEHLPNSLTDILGQLEPEGENISILGRDFDYHQDKSQNIDGWCWSHGECMQSFSSLPKLPLHSMALARESIEYLGKRLKQDWQATKVEQALTNVSSQGRMHLVEHQGVRVIYDVAHNREAIDLLAKRTRKLITKSSGRVLAVAALLSDKLADPNCLKSLVGLVDVWFFAGIEHRSRSSNVSTIKDIVGQLYACKNIPNPQAVSCKSIEKALDLAQERAIKGDTIVVFGSFYTVSQALRHERKEQICSN